VLGSELADGGVDGSRADAAPGTKCLMKQQV
jgi:hypothetical protein